MRLTLEQLRKEKEYRDKVQKDKRVEFTSAKIMLKHTEEQLKAQKKYRNRLEREYKFSIKQVESLDRRIKTYPTKVRKWGREHPGELINTLGEKT